MLRNREIQLLLLIITFITLGFVVLAKIMLSNQAALYILITSMMLGSCTAVFTFWRYREIKKLSSYLRQISCGDYSLDVRDNHEGELSILKNEIYKVTLMLSEHRSQLEQDKIQLINAISDISHQLKTPLTSMMVMADLLSDPKLNESKRAEFTQNIRVQLERIEWLVSSLLKLSKIDAGAVKFKTDQVDAHQMIQKAMDPLLIPLDIKQQTLKLTVEENVTFRGDLHWTVEAFINILKNCIEHTPDGGEISITCSENALFTEIIIIDNGTGISKKDLPYIFKRFFKGENAGYDSAGIGLAMAHSIITSQQGDIEVYSTPGEGTKFRIKFFKQVI